MRFSCHSLALDANLISDETDRAKIGGRDDRLAAR